MSVPHSELFWPHVHLLRSQAAHDVKQPSYTHIDDTHGYLKTKVYSNLSIWGKSATLDFVEKTNEEYKKYLQKKGQCFVPFHAKQLVVV